MYRVDKRTKDRLSLYILMIAIIGLIVGGIVFLKVNLQSETTIVQGSPVTTVVSGDEPTNHYKENVFELSLPSNWRSLKRDGMPAGMYSWESTEKGANKQLDVYVDNLPKNYAVNRVLVVESADDHVNITSQVSDNCTSFTKSPAHLQAPGVPATWEGARFLCDTANYSRNVVGVMAEASRNLFRATGERTGQHQFFFVFTDRSVSPSYTALYKALQSFQVL